MWYKNKGLQLLQVYSTNPNSWKVIYPFVRIESENITGTNIVVINDILYFYGKKKLVSYDLHNEDFGLVPFPKLVQSKRSDALDFQGSVVVVFQSESGGIDLWTLHDFSRC